MSFELVAYERLRVSILRSIESLILHYNKECKIDPDNLELSIKEVPAERQVQALILLKTIELLRNSSDEYAQARVLNAMTFYVREKIAATYKRTSPENSNLFCSLTSSLGINADNDPGRNELLDMYSALESFLCKHVYVKGDARKNYLDDQPFAIDGYSVEDDIKDLNKKIGDLKEEVIDAAKKLHNLQQKPSKGYSGILGGIFGGSSTKSDKPKSSRDSEHKVSHAR